jgi:hypothetical protein
LGPSSTTDKQKEAAWRMEFDALGEQSVLKNVKQGATYNEAKRDRREARTAQLAWGRSLYQRRQHLSASWVVLMALH